MAIRNKLNVALSPVPYTKEVDGSGDHAGLANSTYFKDLSDGLVYFKDGTGTIISLFESGGGNLGDTNLTLSGAATRTYNLDGNELAFIDGANSILRTLPTGIVVGTSSLPANHRVLIKGAGSTALTTALLTENLLGTSFFKVKNNLHIEHETAGDGGTLYNMKSVGTGGYCRLSLNDSGGATGLITAYNSAFVTAFLQDKLEVTSVGGMIFREAASGNYYWSHGSSSEAASIMKLNATGLKIGAAAGVGTPAARVHIKGVGNNNTTKSLIAESANTFNYFHVFNDGNAEFKNNGGGQNLALTTGDGVSQSRLELNADAGLVGAVMGHSSANPLAVFANRLNLTSYKEGIVFRIPAAKNIKWLVDNGTNDGAVDMKFDTTGLLLGEGIGATAVGAKLHVIGSTLLDGNLGVFGTTPIAQPTTAVAPAIITAGVGTNVLHDDLIDGYTLAQVVKALRNLGILA